MNTKVKAHKEICEYLNNLYERKNHDYGDSFHQTFVEEGMAMARIRLGDKFSRFKTLTLKGSQQVQDESVRDTLLDLANYAIMTVMEMDLAGKDEPETDNESDIAIRDPLSMIQTDDEYSVVSAPYCFGYQLAAQEFLEEVNEHIAKYGLISVADIRRMRNEPIKAEDTLLGWVSKIPIKNITQGFSKKRGGSYYWVKFPTPVKLEGVK
ncbi:nucleotide modification associated domain-containing protein [Oscillospiraceae bacterium 21-37]